MKNFVTFLSVFTIVSFACFDGFAQNDNKSIRISKDVELIKLSENAFLHVSYSDIPKWGRIPANGMVFVNGSEAFLFDTPWNDTLTMELVLWLKDTMKLKILGFVPNHWHNDCMGGLAYLQTQKIESYANQMTIDFAQMKHLPFPNHGFKDSLELHIGDKKIQCYYFGAAHSLDNIVVWFPSEQILFAGCMVKSLNSKDLGNTSDGDLTTYPKTLTKLMNRFQEAKIVVPGHGAAGGFELIKYTRELLE